MTTPLEGADMANATRIVGLDVHAAETHATVLDPVTGELVRRRLRGRPHELIPWLVSLGPGVRAVYEAGPTGYGLARRAALRGLDVRVCHPERTSRRPGDRIKTDARDSERLARLLLAGGLTLVRVPEPAEEQLRDLVRAREDLRSDLMRCRHRLSKLLLRRERYWPDSAWTQRHRAWLDRQRFGDRASEEVFSDYLHAHDHLVARRDRLERALAACAADSPWARTVANLRCLRGIDTLSAVGLCAEIGDFGRFRPKQLAAYLGIVPSEHSSGERRRQGEITRAGSKHARRLLVEAAKHYRHQPHISRDLRRRQQGAEPRAIEIAWRAQRRLYRRSRHLVDNRGVQANKATIAIARELAGFCWEIAVLD
jgi:transposase